MTQHAFDQLLNESRNAGRALWAFTCYDVSTAIGVLRAAERADRAVMLLVSERSFLARDGELLAAGLLAVADRSGARACVQLDHCTDSGLLRRASELGFGAVLADGSRLGHEENVRFVSAAVSTASSHGAAVEAELGRIAGDEDRAGAAHDGRLTDPDQAAEFVEATGCACLAVSVGNGHGRYRDAPQIDWARLEAIRARVDVPLAMHGASGLDAATLRRAAGLGMVKINVNTELRAAYASALKAFLAARVADDLLDLQDLLPGAIAEVVSEKLAIA